MIQYIIAAGIGAFLGSRSKKSKKSYAEGGGIGSRFELGTPVNYRTEDYSGNERIESGEVVLRNGKKAIKLYKDSNYSGDGERIRFFNEIDMSQVKNFSDSTYAEGGKIQDVLNAKYKSELKDFWVNESEKGLVLSHIEIKPDKQGMGTATKVMNDLTKYADNKNLIIGTTPSSDFGSSKTRLTEFYKRFGFVNNKGRNKNFAFKDTMIRNPTSYA